MRQNIVAGVNIPLLMVDNVYQSSYETRQETDLYNISMKKPAKSPNDWAIMIRGRETVNRETKNAKNIQHLLHLSNLDNHGAVLNSAQKHIFLLLNNGDI